MFKKKKKQEPKPKKTRLEDMYDVTSSDVAEALARHDDIDVTTSEEEPAPKHETPIERPIEPATSEDMEIAESGDPEIMEVSESEDSEVLEEVVETEAEQPVVEEDDKEDELDQTVTLEPDDEDITEPEDRAETEEDNDEPSIPIPMEDPSPAQVEPLPADTTEEEPSDHYIWATSEEWEEQQAKRKSKRTKRRSRKEDNSTATPEPQKVAAPEVMFPVVEDDEEERDKVDLNSFFDASRNKSRKLKRKDKKRLSKKEQRRRKKRKDKKRTADDIKDKNVFKFRKKKYAKVEDFIAYLNDHYLDIDEVAQLILDDENFFGWISKKSGMFNQSLDAFRTIKSKIEDE